MKRIKIRALALLLSCCLVTVGTIGSYQTAQAAEIVAGGALVGTLEEILLSFGLFLLPSSMIDSAQNPDWWYSEDGNAALKPYYEDLATEYEKERFKVINGGGNKPQPSPTPEPGTTPEVTPVPTGDIPTFDELVAPALAGGAIAWANGAFDVMGKAVGNLWDKIIGTNAVISKEDNPFLYKDYIGYCEEVTDYNETYSWGTIHCLDTVTSYLYDPELIAPSLVRYDRSVGGHGYYLFYALKDTGHFQVYYHRVMKDLTHNTITLDEWIASKNNFTRNYGPHTGGDVNSIKQNYSFYVPIVDVDGKVLQEADNKPLSKEEIWVHPDLQETYQNNGKFEYPAQAPQPLQYPSAENLADLAKKLNPEINPDYSPEIAPNYVQELIQKLQKDPTVNPDPDPNPDPNPKPDPGTDPQPTLAPNPTGAPEQPEKPEDELKPYTADLTKVFPFCIPFDLIHLFEVLDAEPEAPVFKIPIELKVDNPFTGKSIVDYEDTIKIDLSDYEQPIKVIRIFEVIFFLIGLMLITRSHMIKG